VRSPHANPFPAGRPAIFEMAHTVANANSTSALITAEVLAFLGRPTVSDDEFNALALRLFAHQFQHNLPFQRFCQGRGKTPRMVKSWRDIPAVPINAFKDLTLSCVAPEDCARTFMTSGTTRGDVKGRHFHPTMAVYDASMLRNFEQHFMQGRARLRMGILFPTEAVMPNSSLAHYLGLAMAHHGTPESAYYLGEDGLQLDALCSTLAQAQQNEEPFALLGASYGFVHLMDALRARGLRFQLPSGSRLLDTGGFKGQSREVPMDTFYDQLTANFGVSRDHCINMYGMTELSTQFYDAGNASLPSIKRGPHWIRSRLVDPLTGQDVAVGERGILAHTDLANFNSVVSILTEDVGAAADDGFVLLGRAQGAQAKGCSLAVDEFLKAARA
jgi:Acyl-protein synthetase, LuxE